MAQWRDKGGLEPLRAGTGYLQADRTASLVLRGLWQAAFPTRDPLPLGPIADEQGRGEQLFWDVFD